MRITYPTAIVLAALDNGYRHGFEIIDVTGLRAGTVYPILRRLESESLARSSWEHVARARAEGRPPRRNYRLTTAGRAIARAALARYPGVVHQFATDAEPGAAQA